MSKIQKEINDFSGRFKIIFICLFVVYVSFWFFTIHLGNAQEFGGIEPVLPVIPGDSEEYKLLTESIISGEGFGMMGEMETLRTPGYPLFVAVLKILTGSYFAVTFFQILLVFISGLIIRKIGTLFEAKKVGEIAAVFFLFNPATLALSLLVFSDSLFLFLFVYGFYLAINLQGEKLIQKIFIISLIFSFAIYVRPIGFFAFPIFIAPVLASKINFKTRWRLSLLLVVLITLGLLPWTIRNHTKTGIASFTNIADFNLVWVATRFSAMQNNTSLEKENSVFEKSSGVPEESWRDMKHSEAIRKTAASIILNKPFSYAKYHLISAVPFLFPSTIAFARDTYNHSILRKEGQSELGSINFLVSGNLKAFRDGAIKQWWKVLERFGWLLVCVLSLLGLWRQKKSLPAWSFVLIIGYLMFLAGPASGPRYSFQSWPFIFLLFASGVEFLVRKAKSL